MTTSKELDDLDPTDPEFEPDGIEDTIAQRDAWQDRAVAAEQSIDAHRAMTNATFARLRAQLLKALGQDDDGKTDLPAYITQLVAERDAARGCLAEHADCDEPECQAEIAAALGQAVPPDSPGDRVKAVAVDWVRYWRSRGDALAVPGSKTAELVAAVDAFVGATS